MSLYDVKRQEVKVGMPQWSVLSPFLFEAVVGNVNKYKKESALSDLLYADIYWLWTQDKVKMEVVFWEQGF